MHKLKMLKVMFDGDLPLADIPAFRGAIAAKAGWDHLLFHNHRGNGYRYAYPLIQYKSIDRRPVIICLGDGTLAIRHFFEQPSWRVRIRERYMDLDLIKMDMDIHSLEIGEAVYTYHLRHWVALNQHAWPQFQTLTEEAEQIALLERKLIGNILSLAKGIGWHVENRIHVRIVDPGEPRIVKIKDTPMLAFSPTFETNVKLPIHVGLGGKTSIGFGTIYAAGQGASPELLAGHETVDTQQWPPLEPSQAARRPASS